jgi:uncharacterized membrane protein YhiD involved in acid resistance
MPTYTQIAGNDAMALRMGLLIGLERQHSQQADEPRGQEGSPRRQGG